MAGRTGLARVRRGASYLEMVLAASLLACLMAGAAALFQAGNRQQRLTRDYHRAQTELRAAARRVIRSIRHGYRVSPSSGRDRLALEVPEPYAAGGGRVEVSFQVARGVLYARRADRPPPGEAVASGLRGLELRYFRGARGAREAVDGAPERATEVELTLEATRGGAVARATSAAVLRNALAGIAP